MMSTVFDICLILTFFNLLLFSILISFQKTFFLKFELPNSGCGLSVSAAYLPVWSSAGYLPVVICHLVPVISEEYYQCGYFRFVVQLVAMSVLHSGIGIVGLSRALTTYMVTEDVELARCNLSITDVPNYCVQQALMEVHVLLDK